MCTELGDSEFCDDYGYQDTFAADDASSSNEIVSDYEGVYGDTDHEWLDAENSDIWDEDDEALWSAHHDRIRSDYS